MRKNNLSCIRQHKEVAKSTMESWVKEVLKNSATDTRQFKPRPTRSMASSNVSMLGSPVKNIVNRGNRSNKSTW